MLFAPPIAHLLATRTHRRHAPPVRRTRRALLSGARSPHRTIGAAAARRLFPSPGRLQPWGRRRTTRTGTRSVERAS
jgi:hypothetical protein